MKPVRIITILSSIFLFSSCFSNKERGDNYFLRNSEKRILFDLDSYTSTFIQSLFYYEDSDGSEYVTFQNEKKNSILFYDINTGQLMYEFLPEIEGADGVGFFMGYYIHNLDSLFLTALGVQEIVLLNKEAEVKNKINYDKTTDKILLGRSYSTSNYYQPIVMKDDKLYFVSGCNRWGEKNPVSAYVNLSDETVNALPFDYPVFPGADNKNKRAGVEEHMSRCFDGERFIYSFYFDENIYVASVDHTSISKIKVKSKYINKVKIIDDYGNLTAKDICINPNYGNLIYDKYRKVYYRIAYPETEIENNVNSSELLRYGRKKFSIIILDENFNIMGEHLLPDYMYNSMVMFVNKEGLYISTSHFMNPEYNDDILSFDCFYLVKNTLKG